MIESLEKLCIHTITTKPWQIETAVEKFAKTGVKGISVWRDTLANRKISEVGNLIRSNGLEIVSLVRGGFFANHQFENRKAAIEDNRKAILEASELGAPMIVLVCGADPGQSLEESREQIRTGIEEILPFAEKHQIKLAIEPLHPMYAADRSAINTMKQANDMVEAIGSQMVGVAVDVYHVWWDPDLEREIERCGKNNSLFAYHVCDWKVSTADMLNDRGVMGEGCIPLKQIRKMVEKAGFNGFIEVEIFSTRWWSQNQDLFLQQIIEAYQNHT